MNELEILVVDDSESIRQFMREILRQLNTRITEATDGIEAFKLIANNVYDLIFMDIAMPGKSGFDVIERVRNKLGYKYTPIIVMTGLDQPNLIKKAFDIGASDYITKPLSEIEFISRLKTRLENRRLNRALNDANRAKSEFISRLAHELKTPLNAIAGFAEIIELEPTNTEKVLKSCKIIKDASTHQESLINEVTNLANIEAGIIDIKLADVDFSKIIRDVFNLTEPMANKSNVKLNLPRLNEVKFTLKTDAKRLKQILINLITNAIKYNKPGGKVDFVIDQLKPEYLKVSIKDTGNGIDRKDIEKIFEPFNRLGAEKTKIEGTGIGLPITKKIIEIMGGELKVESKVGEGSIFCFTLPL